MCTTHILNVFVFLFGVVGGDERAHVHAVVWCVGITKQYFRTFLVCCLTGICVGV